MQLPPYWSTLPGNVAQEATDNVTWTRIETTDGYRLNCYEMGQQNPEKIVLLNALGLSFALLLKLGMALSRCFHVIGWDARGCPETTDSFEERYASVDVQADDFLRIVEHFGGNIKGVVTWSSGTFVLLRAMQKGFDGCVHRILLAPGDISEYLNKTPFLDYFEPLFVKAAKGDMADVARLRRHILAAVNVKEDVPARTLNVAYVRDNETTHRYALYFNAGLDFRDEARALYAAISQDKDFLIIHSIDDIFSDHRGSLQAVTNSARTRLTLYSAGGHFLLFGDPASVAHDIEAWIERQPQLVN